MADPASALPVPLTPAQRWVRPLVRFLRIESASGVILLVATAAALGLANSPWADAVAHFWHTPVALTVGPFKLAGDLGHLVVNDVLMTVFFFVVGLEIKREVVAGELRDPRAAALPVVAALGGMVVPACLYLFLQRGQPGERGWGVPMATDIAFVVGVMALLGRRVPFGLKIMILSLAIADDIGAVIVIAVFYSQGLSYPMLGIAAGGFALTYSLNRTGVRSVPVYVAVGGAIWLAVLTSGVHPTVAGVLLGLLTPTSAWIGDATLLEVLGVASRRVAGDPDRDDPGRFRDLSAVAYSAREAVSPLERLEVALHPWVGFVIMPLFALANAGVVLRPGAVTEPVAVATAVGLVLGKPVGIVVFSFAAVRLGLARLPAGVSWPVLLGGGCLAGIGFTMSLFIALLALPAAQQDAAKIGVLTGSVVSAGLGIAVLLLARRRPDPTGKVPAPAT